MSEHQHTSNLVTELVMMAQATKRLPELEAELREAYQRIHDVEARNMDLERKIQDEVSINTELASKLHAAEVARDDAGFRQLEAEDRAAALRGAIENVFPALGKTLAALDGDGRSEVRRMSADDIDEWNNLKAEKARSIAEAARLAEEAAKPVDPTPVASPAVWSEASAVATTESSSASGTGERATDPIGESSAPTPLPSAEPSPSSPVSYGGVSVPSDPTVSQQISPSETALGSTVPEQVGARIVDDARTHSPGKYSNRRYADWPYYVSEAGWIEGGGTHESYWEGRAAWSGKTA